ncbi:hypothetical protein BH24ACT5_BH24ACT5_13940 [soil metagenome]
MTPPPGSASPSEPASAPEPDRNVNLVAAADLLDRADEVIAGAVRSLADGGGPDSDQVLAYDVAHAASAVATARVMLDYGDRGTTEAAIAGAFVGDTVHELMCRALGR